jgi:hypothetical protein
VSNYFQGEIQTYEQFSTLLVHFGGLWQLGQKSDFLTNFSSANQHQIWNVVLQ